MRKLHAHGPFSLNVVLSLPLLAIVSTILAVDAPSVDEADHEELRGLKAVFESAVNDNQLDLLLPYLDDHFSVVTYTDREFTDFPAFKEQWQKTREALLKGGRYTVRLLPDRSQLYGDIAVGKGDSENTLTSGSGREQRFSSHWTVVCHKVGGKWKILRAHSSLNPFSNPMLETAVRGMLMKFTIAALVIGLVLGWVAGGLVTRRRARLAAA